MAKTSFLQKFKHFDRFTVLLWTCYTKQKRSKTDISKKPKKSAKIKSQFRGTHSSDFDNNSFRTLLSSSLLHIFSSSSSSNGFVGSEVFLVSGVDMAVGSASVNGFCNSSSNGLPDAFSSMVTVFSSSRMANGSSGSIPGLWLSDWKLPSNESVLSALHFANGSDHTHVDKIVKKRTVVNGELHLADFNMYFHNTIASSQAHTLQNPKSFPSFVRATLLS